MRSPTGLASLGTVFALMTSTACGGGTSSSTCQLRGEVSGAVSWQSGASDPACLVPFSGSTGVEMDFLPLQAAIQRFVVEVPTLKADQTGAFPAQLKIGLPDGRSYNTTTTACTVTIESNALVRQESLGKQYQLEGRGECAGAAMPTGSATGTVTIAPFTFRFPAQFL